LVASLSSTKVRSSLPGIAMTKVETFTMITAAERLFRSPEAAKPTVPL
jgi:hypothetical protein